MSPRTKSVEGDLCLVLGVMLLFGGFVTFFYDTSGGLYPYRYLVLGKDIDLPMCHRRM